MRMWISGVLVGLSTVCAGAATAGTLLPGAAPGPAKLTKQADAVILTNRLLTCTWKSTPDAAHRPQIAIGQTDTLPVGDAEPFTIVLKDGTTLRASQLQPQGPLETTPLPSQTDAVRAALRSPGFEAAIRLVSPDGRVHARWAVVLRDEANYLQQVLTINGPNPLDVRELLVDGGRLPGAEVVGTADGSPVVAGNVFFACEHPMANHRVADDHLSASLNRFEPILPQQPWVVTWTTGLAPAGQMRRAFLYYLERERARPYRPLCYYISWFDIAGVNLFMNEKQCLDVIEQFGREMVTKRGVKLDAFVFDDGWDDTNTLWQFHDGFPQGFAPLQKAAAEYGAFLGTWISPFGGYGKHKKQRLEFGKTHGYEINPVGFSLSGPRYYRVFSDVCARMMHDYGVNYFKFDGIGDFAKSDGPGKYAPDMEALLRLIDDLRKVRADVFINTTAGTWPSPFWLMHSDSVFRGGDDVGWRGVGTNRQRWLSYRDGVGYRIRTARGPLYPLNSLKFQSVICARLDSTISQSGLRGTRLDGVPPLGREPKDLIDDIRMAAGSGTQIQEFFITPSMIAPEVWDVLAETLAWMHRNADVLVDSHGIGGDPWSVEAYGYAAWSPRMGILTLRNPSDQPAKLTVDLQHAFELPPTAPSRYILSSPWRDKGSLQNLTLTAGKPHAFDLAPFQVLTLEALPDNTQ